jgi:hypothetical protein
MDTRLLELESGMTQNESVTYAVRSAIEAAVLALIQQGDERGYWKIVFPENWAEEVDQQERAYWLKLNDQEINDAQLDNKPTSSKDTFWKKIFLKSNPNNGEEK